MSTDVRESKASGRNQESGIAAVVGALSIGAGLGVQWGIGAVLLFVGLVAVAYAVAIHGEG